MTREIINGEVIIREEEKVDAGNGQTTTFIYSDRFNVDLELTKLVDLLNIPKRTRLQEYDYRRLVRRLVRADIFDADRLKALKDKLNAEVELPDLG